MAYLDPPPRGASASLQLMHFATTVLLAAALWTGAPGALAPTAYAQADTSALGYVETAFRDGNVGALMDRAGDRVDLIIFGQGASYSRAQAALVLLDFFRQHPPRSVRFEEEVVAEDRRSVIGQYWAAGGSDPVDIFIRLWDRNGNWEVRAVRIERRSRR